MIICTEWKADRVRERGEIQSIGEARNRAIYGIGEERAVGPAYLALHKIHKTVICKILKLN